MDATTLAATTSGVIQQVQEATPSVPGFTQWVVNIYLYLLAPGTILAFFKIAYEFGKFKKSFDNLSTTVDTVRPVVTRLNSCVNELQSVLKNRYKNIQLVKETIEFYGVANSPIVLKDEFRPFIQESGIGSQIEEKKSKLVELVRIYTPATGLDAQNAIYDLVLSDKIDKVVDTTEFKKILYERGKTAKDYYLILAVYLFEAIIPELFPES